MAVTRALYSGLLDSRKFRNSVALSAFISNDDPTNIPQKIGGQTIHTFSNVGNHTFSVFADNAVVEYLIVAGGGQAGVNGGDIANYSGGGGGAGGYKTGYTTLSRGVNKILTVGAGGSGNSAIGNASTSGQDSTFNSITSLGGGGGASGLSNGGLSGGSGGGGNGRRGGTGNGGGAGTSGQGNSGGTGVWFSNFPDSGDFTGSGGGGGISAAGTGSSINGPAGVGGAGTQNSISSSSIIYASGGNGIAKNVGQAPAPGANGTNGLGNGGNAGSGNGGSGIVIFRYPTPI